MREAYHRINLIERYAKEISIHNRYVWCKWALLIILIIPVAFMIANGTPVCLILTWKFAISMSLLFIHIRHLASVNISSILIANHAHSHYCCECQDKNPYINEEHCQRIYLKDIMHMHKKGWKSYLQVLGDNNNGAIGLFSEAVIVCPGCSEHKRLCRQIF